MKHTFFKALILLFLFLQGQKVAISQIVTHGFKNYTSCPMYFSQVNVCSGWRQPTGGTSDYFNVCAVGTDVAIPYNYFGHQDHPDSAYTGLYTWVGSLNEMEYAEYIGTDISPLTVGHSYTMTLTVSLADKSTHATDGLGVFFSTYLIDSQTIYRNLMVTPQVDYSSYGVVKDSVNWVTLSKTFVADSPYTHLVVGSFKPYKQLTIEDLHNGYSDKVAYYYISKIGLPDTDTPTNPPPVIDPPVEEPVSCVFPSAFTPGKDNKNDVFRIICGSNVTITDYTLRIFNRWGELVYITHDPASGWDGRYKNKDTEIGVYYYFAAYTANGQQRIKNGDLTLIR